MVRNLLRRHGLCGQVVFAGNRGRNCFGLHVLVEIELSDAIREEVGRRSTVLSACGLALFARGSRHRFLR